MAVEGITSLAQDLADQLHQQLSTLQARANTQVAGNADNVAANEDNFTPSTRNSSAQAAAQDAGLFHVNQGTLTTVATNLLFELTSPGAANRGVPAQAGSVTPANADNVQAAPAANSNAAANPGQLFAPTRPGQEPAPKAAPSTNLQEKVQALNADLPALGLSKVEIQEIDTLATQIQNFNPAAYTAMINQFEALAQQATQQRAANEAANASAAASQKAAADIKANGGGSHS